MKTAASLILLFLYSVVSAQSDTSYNCVARWKKVDTQVILINHKIEKSWSGNPEPPVELSYEAHIQVLDSSEEGYTLKWVFHLPQEIKKANPMIGLAMPVYEGMKMIFKTDSKGRFKELINWTEVKDTYLKMMIFSLPRNLSDSARKAIDKSNAMFNSREMAESSFINEIQLYYAPFSSTFTLNGKKFPAISSTPYSGNSIQTIVSEKLLSLSSSTDNATVELSQHINLNNPDSLVNGMLKKMELPDDSLATNVSNMMAGTQVTFKQVYQFTVSSGWLKKMTYQKSAVNDLIRKTEYYSFELK